VLKVVYILAHSRSGSTLLARMLGQVENWTSVGEVRYLWRRGMVENQRCGCGEQFSDCSFWTPVTQKAFGRVDQSMAIEMARLLRHADRMWRIGRLGYRRLGSRRSRERLSEVLQLLSRVYTAVQEVSTASVIVDSSKSPSYGYLLSLTPGVQVHLVHLVRDCRGVAYSRLRRNALGELHWKSENLLVARTALEWVAVNVLSHLLKSTLPYTLVKYEDFAKDPQHTLRRIVTDAGQPTPSLSFVNQSTVLVGADHIVSGNQMRFESGWISVKPDEEWRRKLARRHLWIVNAITWPWLVRYGYV
jgi:hypothetical protein